MDKEEIKTVNNWQNTNVIHPCPRASPSCEFRKSNWASEKGLIIYVISYMFAKSYIWSCSDFPLMQNCPKAQRFCDNMLDLHNLSFRIVHFRASNKQILCVLIPYDLAWKRRQNSGPARKVFLFGKTEVVTDTLFLWSMHGGKHGRRTPWSSLASVWLPMSLLFNERELS